MKQKSKKILLYAVSLRAAIIFAGLCNFVWYFSHSMAVKESGSDVISFCVACAWYWEGAHAAKPFILLYATLFMVSGRWWGYLITAVISGYEVIEGIIWVSQGAGFVSGLSQRIEFISTSVYSKIWEFLDWQYVLALIIFITSSGYLIAGIVKIRQNKINP